MGKVLTMTFVQYRYTNSQKAHEKCSISVVIRKMKSKSKIKYHFITTRVARITKTQQITSVGKDVEKLEPCALMMGI